MNSVQVEDALLRAGMGQRVNAWTVCPACGRRILQAVAALHIREEHPQIAADIERAIERAGERGDRTMTDAEKIHVLKKGLKTAVCLMDGIYRDDLRQLVAGKLSPSKCQQQYVSHLCAILAAQKVK